MSRAQRPWKRWVRMGLFTLLGLDAILLLTLWTTASADPKAQRARRDRLAIEHSLLKTDVERGRDIQDRLPRVEQECNRFVRERLLAYDGGYSTMVDDLGKIARDAGLKIGTVTFKESALEKRGVVQVKVSASVEGEYASLVRFVNGLERSENFYLLDGLSLASSDQGVIRLNLELRSYLRS